MAPMKASRSGSLMPRIIHAMYVALSSGAMLLTMATPKDFTGPINVGNPAEITMFELAERVLALTGGKSRIVLKPLPHDDPRQRQPDIRLAENVLGWRPRVSLDDGLKRTIEYFRQLLRA